MQLKHTQRDSLILWSYCSVFDQGKKHIHFNHCDGVGPAVWLPGCPPGWARLQPADTWQCLACQTNKGALDCWSNLCWTSGAPALSNSAQANLEGPLPCKHHLVQPGLPQTKAGSKHFRTGRAGVDRSHKQHTQDYRSLERGKKDSASSLLPWPLSQPQMQLQEVWYSPADVNFQHKDHLDSFH